MDNMGSIFILMKTAARIPSLPRTLDADGEIDMGFFPYGTATHREILALGHKVWRDKHGVFCVENGENLPRIPDFDWLIADASQTEEDALMRSRNFGQRP